MMDMHPPPAHVQPYVQLAQAEGEPAAPKEE